MFELKNKKVNDMTITTKSQLDRSKVTIQFLSKNRAPSKFRDSINDAYRSRVLDKTLGGSSAKKYVAETFRVRHEMKNVLSHGETGHWCTAMIDTRVYDLIDGEINCASVIRKLHDLWMGMDKEEIKKILEIDFLNKFGDSHNVILGDKVDSSEEFVNVMTHIMYSKDCMRDDFKKALESSRRPNRLPNIVINKRFRKGTSIQEAHEQITNSQEWIHPDVKSFSSDEEFCMFFDESSKFAIKDLISEGFLPKNVTVRDVRGETEQKVRGSGCDNVVHFTAYPKSKALSSDYIRCTIARDSTFRCCVCSLTMKSFVHAKNKHTSFLEVLRYNVRNWWGQPDSLVCKECIANANTLETEKAFVRCLVCDKRKSSFSSCLFYIQNKGLGSVGEGLCTECIECTTSSELLHGYAKRSKACMEIQQFGRKYVAKRTLDDLRCDPDNMFDPEHGQLRKKILKIDDSRFGSF